MGKKLYHKEGIYMILSLKDNKKYIGEAVSIYKRWWGHRMNLRFNRHTNRHLQNAWNKYGEENFIFHIVEVMNNSTKSSRLDREKYWTDFYNTENEDFGYNFANVHNEEKLNKKKEKVILKPRILKKVIELDLNNTIIKEWDSVKELADFHKKRENKMRQFIWTDKKPDKSLSFKDSVFVIKDCYNKTFDYSPKTHFKLRLKKEKPLKVLKTPEERNIKRNPISIQNIETQEIRNYKSLKEASLDLKFTKSVIHNLIKGFKNKGGGKVVKITQWKGWKILN